MTHKKHGDAFRVQSTDKLGDPRLKRNPWNCRSAWFWLLSVFISLILVEAAALAAEMVRVKVRMANLRSGPGTHFEKVWKVPRNYPFRVLKREGRWLKVRDFEGFEDWIYGPLTDHKPAVVVKVKRANIRKGPGTNYPVVFQTDWGVPFRVLKKKGKWLKVRHDDGDKGWIFQKLVWGSS
ncbi:MAG: SH3 domain-containing protein [Candidatus Binatia bacterium]